MNSSYTFVADLRQQIPDIPADSIISRTLYNTDEVKVILFAFAAGQELSEHTAATPAMLYFVQGDADLMLGDDRQTAQAGTWVQMPPRLPHRIAARTPVVMLLWLLKASTSSA